MTGIATGDWGLRPGGRFTCSGCEETWSGIAMAHCSAEGCHRTFSRASGFDRHRKGGKCHAPSSVGMRRDRNGVWRLPAREGTLTPQGGEKVAEISDAQAGISIVEDPVAWAESAGWDDRAVNLVRRMKEMGL